jgi:hypothetical protein
MLILGSGLLVGCTSNDKAKPSANSKQVLARVGSQSLYWADIADVIPKATSPADSVAFLKRYADGWIRKQLLMKQATAETQGDADDIDKKVAEYREYLVLQAFEEHYVSKNMDTIVTDQEITDYYRTNPENFTLQQNIVRARLVAVPKNVPTLERARNWMQVDNARNRKELQSFAYRFANFYHLDSSWVALDELVRNTPFRDMEKGRLLKNNRFTETSDQQNVYLLVVKEYRLPSQPAPLVFIKPQIRDILIHRRKVKMIQELEKKVYEDGEKRKAFEILVK